jgi:hypothetical protein
MSDGVGVGTLRNAILQSNTNGQNNTIILSAGTYGLSAFAGGELLVVPSGHTETIQGAGAKVTTITANQIDRVFEVLGAGNVIFKNLTITGGLATNSGSVGGPAALGGGLLNNGGTVTLDHVVVSGNQARATAGNDAQGGGIYTTGGMLIIKASTIDHNTARGGAGAAGIAGVAGTSVVQVTHQHQHHSTVTVSHRYPYYSTTTNTYTHVHNSTTYNTNVHSYTTSSGGTYTTSTRTSHTVPYTTTTQTRQRSTNYTTTRTQHTVPYTTTTRTAQTVRNAGGNGSDGRTGGRGQGGGLYVASGLLTLTNSTFSSNEAIGGAGGNGGDAGPGNPSGAGGNGGNGGAGEGGGLFIAGGSVNLFSGTIADNEALNSLGGGAGVAGSGAPVAGIGMSGQGGGVFVGAGIFTPINTLFGGNAALNTAGVPASGNAPDCFGNLTNSSHNLIQDGTGSNLAPAFPDANGNMVGSGAAPVNPLLGPLADNGGQTQTHALFAGSPAIGAGTAVGLPSTDQRDFFRTAPDIGAYAVNASPPAPPITSAPGTTFAGSPAAPTQTVATPTQAPAEVHYFASGAGPGAAPQVNVYNAATGALVTSFYGLPASFTGGVRVAVGDVNGDGTDDIICAAGPGAAPQITVYDGKTFQPFMSFYGLPVGFTGGCFVAVGDVNGDSFADIIVSADCGGGPQVTITSGKDGTMLASFYATAPTFTGGIRVACADLFGTGHADVIAAAGPGGGPQVTIFSGKTLSLRTAFYALPVTFTGGMYIAAGIVNGKGDIIVGAEKGGGPEVNVFDAVTQQSLEAFYALPATFTGGVRVAFNSNFEGHPGILTVAGPGGGPQTLIFDAVTEAVLDSFYAFAPVFGGGVYVGGN